MGQMGFYVDTTSCTGCRCCQVACKDRKDLPVGVFFRRVGDYDGGAFPRVWAASLSLACNHCTDPQCAAFCPVAAYEKDPDTGLVIQDTEMCIACLKCIDACPYGEPAYNPERDEVRKCDGCIDLVRAGEEPACVGACSTRALRFGEVSELAERFGSQPLTSDLACLPSSDITHPNTLINPKPELLA